MTNYVVRNNDYTYGIVTSPQASGPQQHKIVNGAVDGVSFWGYSGQVNGTTTFYVVDNGAAGGLGLSAS